MSTRTSPPQLAFSSGEISPLLHHRSDYQRFQTGLREANGFIPLRQGGITRCPGTIHRGTTRNNQPARLMKFEFAALDALVLEWTDRYLRVWRYGALVEVAPGEPFELETPYDFAAVQRLQYVQSADVIYLADGVLPIQKLSRFALDNWTIAPLELETGPFRVEGGDENFYITSDGLQGSVTLTATQPLFTPQHVNSLLRLEPESFRNIPIWRPDAVYTNGHFMRNERRVYRLITGKNTGITPPLHRRGIEKTSHRTNAEDVRWEYISENHGVVRITEFVSDTEVVAQVLMRLPPEGVEDVPFNPFPFLDPEPEPDPDDPPPDDVYQSTRYRFSEGAWSDVYGYPAALEIHDQRLAAANTPQEPRTVWFSAVGDFGDFTPGIEADDAFAFSIAGDDNQNPVKWLKSGARALHIGALGAEYSTRSDTRNQVIGATTARFGFDSNIGSATGRPITPDGVPIFISRDKRRVFEMRYSLEDDRSVARELSLPSEHLGYAGFEQIVWQSAPLRTAWLVRGDGYLAALVHDPSEDVLGWSRVSVAGGKVISVAVYPDPDTGADLLSLCVERMIAGVTEYHIEDQSHPVMVPTDLLPEIYLFASAVLDFDTPQSVLELPHLAGRDVMIIANKDETLATASASGQIVLSEPVTSAIVGLFDPDHVLELLDIQAAAQDGNTLGRAKRLHSKTGIGVHRTGQALMQVVQRNLSTPTVYGTVQTLVRQPVGRSWQGVHSGVEQVDLPSGHAKEVSLRFQPVGNAPFTLTAVTPRVQETG